ncbi:MAG: IclR family transcriptional regulator [Deinococcales bacterium]
MSDQPNPTYVVAALDKGLTLLRHLADYPNSGVSDIAARTGSTKSQVFRLLYTLERQGFVHKDPVSRNYALGHTCLFLGEHVRSRSSLVSVAEPVMARLVAETQENVHLVVREGLNSVVLALEESHQPVRLYAQVGREGPLHAGGSSMELLAHAPESVVDDVLAGPLTAFTDRTETRPEAVRRTLRNIRAAGHHVALGDLDEGAFSIAAPIRDHRGTVVAALSIAGPLSRLTPSIQANHVLRVTGAAEHVSVGLGAPVPAAAVG